MPPPAPPGPPSQDSACLVIVVGTPDGDAYLQRLDAGEVLLASRLDYAKAYNAWDGEIQYKADLTSLRVLGYTCWTAILGLAPTTSTTDDRYVAACRLI